MSADALVFVIPAPSRNPLSIEERTMTLQIYDPTTEATGRRIDYAPRPKSLKGLRIGLVDNTKHNSDQLLLRIAAVLEREHGAKAHIIRKKRSAGAAPSPEMIEEYKANCDVVVAGIGD
jgi:hypothetical protein